MRRSSPLVQNAMALFHNEDLLPDQGKRMTKLEQ